MTGLLTPVLTRLRLVEQITTPFCILDDRVTDLGNTREAIDDVGF